MFYTNPKLFQQYLPYRSCQIRKKLNTVSNILTNFIILNLKQVLNVLVLDDILC